MSTAAAPRALGRTAHARERAGEHEADHGPDAETKSPQHIGALVDQALHHVLVRHAARGARSAAAPEQEVESRSAAADLVVSEGSPLIGRRLAESPVGRDTPFSVVLPIAFETARQLHLNPRSFAMMIAIAASCSCLTPLEPSSLMVYGPGKSRFMDFVKVGFPLIFLISAVALAFTCA